MKRRKSVEHDEVVVLVLDFESLPPNAGRLYDACIRHWIDMVSPVTGSLCVYSYTCAESDPRLPPPWRYGTNGWTIDLTRGSLPTEASVAFSADLGLHHLLFEECPAIDTQGNCRQDGHINFMQHHQSVPDIKLRIIASLPVSIINKRGIDTHRLFGVLVSKCGEYPGCVGGFLTVEDAVDVQDGAFFTGMTGPPSQYWDMRDLLYNTEGPDRYLLARDVFVGNYFGPKFLAKHDADGLLRKQFMAYTDGDDDTNEAKRLEQTIMHTESGGAFLLLGKNPENYSSAELGTRCFAEASWLAIWLHRELRKRRALL